MKKGKVEHMGGSGLKLKAMGVCPCCGELKFTYKMPELCLEDTEGCKFLKVMCDECSTKLIIPLGDPIAAVSQRYAVSGVTHSLCCGELQDFFLQLIQDIAERGVFLQEHNKYNYVGEGVDASEFAKEYIHKYVSLGYVELVTLAELAQIVIDTARINTKIGTYRERAKYTVHHAIPGW